MGARAAVAIIRRSLQVGHCYPRARLNNHIVECSQLAFTARRLTFPVMQCSDYSDRRLPQLREMEEIAWILRTDALRKRVGFVRSSDLDDKDRFVLED